MTTTTAIETPANPRRNRFWHYLTSKQLARDSLYLLVTLVFSIVAFTLFVVGQTLTWTLIFFIVGFVVFAGFAAVTRWWTGVQRRWSGLVLGAPIESRYRPLPNGLLARVRTVAADVQTWRDQLWLLVDSLMGFGFAVGWLTMWGFVLGSLTLPIWYWSLPDSSEPIQYLIFDVKSTGEAFYAVGVGLIAVPLAAWIGRGMALAHAHTAKALLGPGSRARVEELTETRAGAVDAAQDELQRIERDLHDGAQARLVALAMDLGMAEKKLLEDPATGRELIGEARNQALQTLAELRDLVRGIAPSILRDRGLSAALGSLTASRTPPIELDVDVDGRRPPATVETAAYFVVAEAIANAGKHAGAERIRIRVRRADGRLFVTVEDDGPGGARIEPSGGLDGLSKRVAALDGKLHVVSPPGGPTIVSADIPCE